jgi:hypothetical protein
LAEIVHHNVTPAKLLIDDDGEVHLNGFATSQLVQRGFLDPGILGDQSYAAPNVSPPTGIIGLHRSVFDRNATFIRLVGSSAN